MTLSRPLPSKRSKLPNAPLLYLITDRQQFSAPSQQLDHIAAAAQAGLQMIQIREKDLSVQELTRFVRAAIVLAKAHGTKVLVNDRLDVALATGADGVHLRVNSLPVAEVRRIVPTDFLIGASTHSLAEAKAAEVGGADFIVCGPVFPTPSKTSFGPPLGLTEFAMICSELTIPVLALGGITMDNMSQPFEHGAAGIAAIRLFSDPNTLGTNINIVLSSTFIPQD